MTDEFKVLLVLAPLVLITVFGMMHTFITNSEFRKGIYIICGLGAAFTGWVFLIRAL
ncbi:MAG: hypothetical protein JRE23_08735 [Deltaproteobacteria bacterium]|nr:hypothetical protein [Deltaproteobacteria bacterium]